MSETISLAQAAEILRVTKFTLRNFVLKGEGLKPVRGGGGPGKPYEFDRGKVESMKDHPDIKAIRSTLRSKKRKKKDAKSQTLPVPYQINKAKIMNAVDVLTQHSEDSERLDTIFKAYLKANNIVTEHDTRLILSLVLASFEVDALI